MTWRKVSNDREIMQKLCLELSDTLASTIETRKERELRERIAELEAENVALRKLCGEVWAWDRSREREFGKIPGPLNVGLRTRLYSASNEETTDGE